MAGNKRKKQNKYFRPRDFVVVVLCLFIAVLFLDMFRNDLLQTLTLQNVEPIGTVVVRKNTVQRRLGDRVLWDRLAKESPVYIWDLIRVAETSSATLYIDDNSIDLNENTLIRIVPSLDDKGIMIMLSEGTLSVSAGESSSTPLTLDIGGQVVRPEPRSVLSASVPQVGPVNYKVYESVTQYVRENPVVEIPRVELISPAVNSVFRYLDNTPVLTFQWTAIEEAVSYSGSKFYAGFS